MSSVRKALSLPVFRGNKQRRILVNKAAGVSEQR
jgi:hypothetical protein